MKKNHLKNIGRICLVIAGLIITASLNSCKDSSPGAVNFADSPALVGFQYYGFNATPIQTVISGTASDYTLVEVTVSVHTIVMKTPVEVTVAADPTDAAAFIASNQGNGFVALPASQYTIANGGNLTIEPGQQIYYLKVSFAGNQINFNGGSNVPVLGLKITSATGATIESNLNVAILYLLENAG